MPPMLLQKGKDEFDQLPLRANLSALTILRVVANTKDMATSATESFNTSGVFVTRIFFVLVLLKSIMSIPTPKLDISSIDSNS